MDELDLKGALEWIDRPADPQEAGRLTTATKKTLGWLGYINIGEGSP